MQPAAADHDEVVGGQRHLAHQVGGDEDRAALGRQALSRSRTQSTPSGSRPLTGSSRISVAGSPSSAEAMPSRWPMPSEKPPARLRATSPQPDHAR